MLSLVSSLIQELRRKKIRDKLNLSHVVQQVIKTLMDLTSEILEKPTITVTPRVRLQEVPKTEPLTLRWELKLNQVRS